ncbi:hypothetical protein QNM99_15800 [Pseudomonas sp. PCH446]
MAVAASKVTRLMANNPRPSASTISSSFIVPAAMSTTPCHAC